MLSKPLIDIGVKGSSAICGNIIRYFLIPNSYLILVAFSAEYFALVNWITGIVICDAEVISKKCNSNNMFVIIQLTFHRGLLQLNTIEERSYFKGRARKTNNQRKYVIINRKHSPY